MRPPRAVEQAVSQEKFEGLCFVLFLNQVN